MRSIHYGTAKGEWRENLPRNDGFVAGTRATVLGAAVLRLAHDSFRSVDPDSSSPGAVPWSGLPSIVGEDREQLYRLVRGFLGWELPPPEERPFAGAPVRSKPRRTYDPARPVRDPEGEHVPMYLSTVFFEDKKSWGALKDALDDFGREAGLFDEISVRPLGKRGSEPFQMRVRKYGRRTKGPMRNLIDVGYGVSQVLPILTELFRDSRTSMFLLQQPEVHLHPSAQAALGSLFCRLVGRRRQLVVETHSDHLLDRVRMDVRDGRTKLTPEDRLDSVLRAPRPRRQDPLVATGRGRQRPGCAGELSSLLHGRNAAVVDVVGCVRFSTPTWPDRCSARIALRREERSPTWINSGRGRLVVGGRLRRELDANREFRKWRLQAVLAGRVTLLNDEAVDDRASQLERDNACRSDDEHVVAVAQLGGARLLYSNDTDLQADFGDKALIDQPRGKVYSTRVREDLTRQHRRLLADVSLCASSR